MSIAKTSPHLLVVGGGFAAGELAIAARAEGWAGDITLLGEETWLPYQRPPLSKAFLSGELDAAALHPRAQAAFDKAGIQVQTGTRVTMLNPAARQTVLANGDRLSYDKLALATGGRARRLGGDLGAQAQGCHNVHYLRGIGDAQRLREQMAPGKRMVIVGGGYVGLEVAASARKMQMQVTLLEAQERVLARVTAPAVSAFYAGLHVEEGVDLRTGVHLVKLEADAAGQAICAVHCADGSRIACDVLVVGIGQLPNAELAAEAGLEVDNGIVIDAACRTSDPHIVAAGDCTSQFNPLAGRAVRLESVPSATEQARTAAASLCGKERAPNFLPWFWSDQYGLKLQMVGFSAGHERVVIRGAMEKRSFAAFYMQGDRILAVDVVNRPQEFMVCKRLVGESVMVRDDALCDDGMPLKSLLV